MAKSPLDAQHPSAADDPPASTCLHHDRTDGLDQIDDDIRTHGLVCTNSINFQGRTLELFYPTGTEHYRRYISTITHHDDAGGMRGSKSGFDWTKNPPSQSSLFSFTPFCWLHEGIWRWIMHGWAQDERHWVLHQAGRPQVKSGRGFP